MPRWAGWLSGLVVAAVLGLAFLAPAAQSSAAGHLDGRSICLDAGHGGSDPGAFHGGIEEQSINLDIAQYLEAAWSAEGVAVTMTRTAEDETLSSRDRYERCNAAGSDILVSVHTNASTNPSVDGTLTIYFHNDDRVLAEQLQESMYGALRLGVPHAFTEFGLKKDALGVLLKSDMPAATVEPVLMSHPWEVALLAESTVECSDASNLECRRVQIAEAIRTGVDAYFAANPDGGGGSNPGEGGECRPAWHAKCLGG